ncbi:hypothetical protein ACFL1K_03735 [Candidatus Omnitrophota bacterium]
MVPPGIFTWLAPLTFLGLPLLAAVAAARNSPGLQRPGWHINNIMASYVLKHKERVYRLRRDIQFFQRYGASRKNIAPYINKLAEKERALRQAEARIKALKRLMKEPTVWEFIGALREVKGGGLKQLSGAQRFALRVAEAGLKQKHPAISFNRQQVVFLPAVSWLRSLFDFTDNLNGRVPLIYDGSDSVSLIIINAEIANTLKTIKVLVHEWLHSGLRGKFLCPWQETWLMSILEEGLVEKWSLEAIKSICRKHPRLLSAARNNIRDTFSVEERLMEAIFATGSTLDFVLKDFRHYIPNQEFLAGISQLWGAKGEESVMEFLTQGNSVSLGRLFGSSWEYIIAITQRIRDRKATVLYRLGIYIMRSTLKHKQRKEKLAAGLLLLEVMDGNPAITSGIFEAICAICGKSRKAFASFMASGGGFKTYLYPAGQRVFDEILSAGAIKAKTNRENIGKRLHKYLLEALQAETKRQKMMKRLEKGTLPALIIGFFAALGAALGFLAPGLGQHQANYAVLAPDGVGWLAALGLSFLVLATSLPTPAANPDSSNNTILIKVNPQKKAQLERIMQRLKALDIDYAVQEIWEKIVEKGEVAIRQNEAENIILGKVEYAQNRQDTFRRMNFIPPMGDWIDDFMDASDVAYSLAEFFACLEPRLISVKLFDAVLKETKEFIKEDQAFLRNPEPMHCNAARGIFPWLAHNPQHYVQLLITATELDGAILYWMLEGEFASDKAEKESWNSTFDLATGKKSTTPKEKTGQDTDKSGALVQKPPAQGLVRETGNDTIDKLMGLMGNFPEAYKSFFERMKAEADKIEITKTTYFTAQIFYLVSEFLALPGKDAQRAELILGAVFSCDVDLFIEGMALIPVEKQSMVYASIFKKGNSRLPPVTDVNLIRERKTRYGFQSLMSAWFSGEGEISPERAAQIRFCEEKTAEDGSFFRQPCLFLACRDSLVWSLDQLKRLEQSALFHLFYRKSVLLIPVFAQGPGMQESILYVLENADRPVANKGEFFRERFMFGNELMGKFNVLFKHPMEELVRRLKLLNSIIWCLPAEDYFALLAEDNFATALEKLLVKGAKDSTLRVELSRQIISEIESFIKNYAQLDPRLAKIAVRKKQDKVNRQGAVIWFIACCLFGFALDDHCAVGGKVNSEEIKGRYRKLVLNPEYRHPDAGGPEEGFKMLTAARELLEKAVEEVLNYRSIAGRDQAQRLSDRPEDSGHANHDITPASQDKLAEMVGKIYPGQLKEAEKLRDIIYQVAGIFYLTEIRNIVADFNIDVEMASSSLSIFGAPRQRSKKGERQMHYMRIFNAVSRFFKDAAEKGKNSREELNRMIAELGEKERQALRSFAITSRREWQESRREIEVNIRLILKGLEYSAEDIEWVIRQITIHESARDEPRALIAQLNKFHHPASTAMPAGAERMFVSKQVREDIGLMEFGAWRLDKIFPELTGISKEAQAILAGNLTHPATSDEAIAAERSQYICLSEKIGAVGLKEITDLLPAFVRAKNGYYQQLRRLHNRHYAIDYGPEIGAETEAMLERMRKGHTIFDEPDFLGESEEDKPAEKKRERIVRESPFTFGGVQPDITAALMCLLACLSILQRIVTRLPDNLGGRAQKYKERIKAALANPEIKPFLECRQLLEVAAEFYFVTWKSERKSNIQINSYLLFDPLKLNQLYAYFGEYVADDCYLTLAEMQEFIDRGIPVPQKHNKERKPPQWISEDCRVFFDREAKDEIREAWAWQKKMRAAGKLAALVKEFNALLERYSDFWRINEPAQGKKTLRSGEVCKGNVDRYPYLRRLPSSVLQGPLCRLEYLLRLALIASREGWNFAELGHQDGAIGLEAFCSPLVKNPVPIRVRLGGNNNALLLSGPNMGGKTRTAQAITLAVLLNQAAFPLPDANPRLGIFKNIYTIFPQSEQLQEGYGYFAELIRRLVDLIKKAGPGNLVVLDEVPTGTDYEELVAIAVVLIEDLINTGATVIVTGHLKKAFEILAERTQQIPYQHTVSRKGKKVPADFGMKHGVAKHSYAIQLIEQLDFPGEILQRAHIYYSRITGQPEEEQAEAITEAPPEKALSSKEGAAKADAGDNAEFDWFFGGGKIEEELPPEIAIIKELVKALYPQENFVFGGGDSWRDGNSMKFLFDILRGNSEGSFIAAMADNAQEALGFKHKEPRDKEKEEEIKKMLEKLAAKYQTQSQKAGKPADQRLRIISGFVGLSADTLNKLADYIAKLKPFIQTDSWRQEAKFEPEQKAQKIQQLTVLLRRLIDTLEGCGLSSSLPDIIGFLAFFLRSKIMDFEELLESYPAKKELKQLKKEARDLGLESWEQDYLSLAAMIRDRLMLLDFYCGVAKSIKGHGLNAPELTDEPNVFSLTESKPFTRHCFLGDPYILGGVAQSFWIDPQKPMVVVTGPNSSGKSVAFFNAYANAPMALKGLYVSGNLRISRYDNVYGFFGGRNVAGRGVSYFFDIMKQCAKIIKAVTDNSLVILDELHGTDNFELAAIQLAILHYLRGKKCSVIFNTHIRDGLKELAEEIGIDFWKTDVDYNPATRKLKFHYTLSHDPNLEAKSYGLAVASEFLSEGQVARIEEVLALLQREKSEPPFEPGKDGKPGEEILGGRNRWQRSKAQKKAGKARLTYAMFGQWAKLVKAEDLCGKHKIYRNIAITESGQVVSLRYFSDLRQWYVSLDGQAYFYVTKNNIIREAVTRKLIKDIKGYHYILEFLKAMEEAVKNPQATRAKISQALERKAKKEESAKIKDAEILGHKGVIDELSWRQIMKKKELPDIPDEELLDYLWAGRYDTVGQGSLALISEKTLVEILKRQRYLYLLKIALCKIEYVLVLNVKYEARRDSHNLLDAAIERANTPQQKQAIAELKDRFTRGRLSWLRFSYREAAEQRVRLEEELDHPAAPPFEPGKGGKPGEEILGCRDIAWRKREQDAKQAQQGYPINGTLREAIEARLVFLGIDKAKIQQIKDFLAQNEYRAVKIKEGYILNKGLMDIARVLHIDLPAAYTLVYLYAFERISRAIVQAPVEAINTAIDGVFKRQLPRPRCLRFLFQEYLPFSLISAPDFSIRKNYLAKAFTPKELLAMLGSLIVSQILEFENTQVSNPTNLIAGYKAVRNDFFGIMDALLAQTAEPHLLDELVGFCRKLWEKASAFDFTQKMPIFERELKEGLNRSGIKLIDGYSLSPELAEVLDIVQSAWQEKERKKESLGSYQEQRYSIYNKEEFPSPQRGDFEYDELLSWAVTNTSLEFTSAYQLYHAMTLANMALCGDFRKRFRDKLAIFKKDEGDVPGLEDKLQILAKMVRDEINFGFDLDANRDVDGWGFEDRETQLRRLDINKGILFLDKDTAYFTEPRGDLEGALEELELRIKNELLPGIYAWRRYRDGSRKGKSKCVGLALLYAALLPMLGIVDPQDVYILGNLTHLFVYIDRGEGYITSNKVLLSADKIRVAGSVNFADYLGAREARWSCLLTPLNLVITSRGYYDGVRNETTLPITEVNAVIEKLNRFFGCPVKSFNRDNVRFVQRSLKYPQELSDCRTSEQVMEEYFDHEEGDPLSVGTFAKYATRCSFGRYAVQRLNVFAVAALRDWHIREKAGKRKGLDELLLYLRSFPYRKSFFETYRKEDEQSQSISRAVQLRKARETARISHRTVDEVLAELSRGNTLPYGVEYLALPDEVIIYRGGNHRDLALLLFALIKFCPNISIVDRQNTYILFAKDKSYVFCNGQYIDTDPYRVERVDAIPDAEYRIFNEKGEFAREVLVRREELRDEVAEVIAKPRFDPLLLERARQIVHIYFVRNNYQVKSFSKGETADEYLRLTAEDLVRPGQMVDVVVYYRDSPAAAGFLEIKDLLGEDSRPDLANICDIIEIPVKMENGSRREVIAVVTVQQLQGQFLSSAGRQGAARAPKKTFAFIEVVGRTAKYRYFNPAMLPNGNLVARRVSWGVDITKYHYSEIVLLVRADSEGLKFTEGKLLVSGAEDPRIMRIGDRLAMTYVVPKNKGESWNSWFVYIDEEGNPVTKEGDPDPDPVRLGRPKISSKNTYITDRADGKVALIDRADVLVNGKPAIQAYIFDSLRDLLSPPQGYWKSHPVDKATILTACDAQGREYSHIGFNTIVERHQDGFKIAFVHLADVRGEKDYSTAGVLLDSHTMQPLGRPTVIHDYADYFFPEDLALPGVIYETGAQIIGDKIISYAGIGDSRIARFEESVEDIIDRCRNAQEPDIQRQIDKLRAAPADNVQGQSPKKEALSGLSGTAPSSAAAPALELIRDDSQSKIDKDKIWNTDPYFLKTIDYFNQVVLVQNRLTWSDVITIFRIFRGERKDGELHDRRVKSVTEQFRTLVERAPVFSDSNILEGFGGGVLELANLSTFKDRPREEVIEIAYLIYRELAVWQLFAGQDGFGRAITNIIPHPADGHHRVAWFVMNYFLIHNGYEPFYFDGERECRKVNNFICVFLRASLSRITKFQMAPTAGGQGKPAAAPAAVRQDAAAPAPADSSPGHTKNIPVSVSGDRRPRFNLATAADELLPRGEIKKIMDSGNKKGELETRVIVYREDEIRISLLFKWIEETTYGKKAYEVEDEVASLTLRVENTLRVAYGNRVLDNFLRDILWNDTSGYREGMIQDSAGGQKTARFYYNLNWMAVIKKFEIHDSLRGKGIGYAWYNSIIEPYLRGCGFDTILLHGTCIDEEYIRKFWFKQRFSERFPIDLDWLDFVSGTQIRFYVSAKKLSSPAAPAPVAGWQEGEANHARQAKDEIDPRPTQTGLLNPEHVRYFMEIRNVINPHGERKIGFYPSSGADAVGFWLMTDAETGVFLGSSWHAKPVSREAYFKEKYAKGWNVADHVVNTVAQLFWELEAIGAENIKKKKIGDDLYEIEFDWAYWQENIRHRRIIILNSYLESVMDSPYLLDILSKGFDFYLQKGGLGIERDKKFAKFVARYINAGGWMISEYDTVVLISGQSSLFRVFGGNKRFLSIQKAVGIFGYAGQVFLAQKKTRENYPAGRLVESSCAATNPFPHLPRGARFELGDLIYVLGNNKYIGRQLFAGGPLRQPLFCLNIKPHREVKSDFNPILSLLIDNTGDKDIETILEQILSGEIPLPVIFKPHVSANGYALFFMRQTAPYEITVTASSIGNQYRFFGYPEGVKVVKDKDIVHFIINTQLASAKKVILQIYHEMLKSFGPALIEAAMPAVLYKGKAFETRHRFSGNLATGEVALKHTGDDPEAPVEKRRGGWFARVGSSAEFSNLTGRTLADHLGRDDNYTHAYRLQWENMFDPLYEIFGMNTDKERLDFRNYVDNVIISQFRYLAQRLEAAGIYIRQDVAIGGGFDLMWLAPENEGFPVPFLTEIDLDNDWKHKFLDIIVGQHGLFAHFGPGISSINPLRPQRYRPFANLEVPYVPESPARTSELPFLSQRPICVSAMMLHHDRMKGAGGSFSGRQGGNQQPAQTAKPRLRKTLITSKIDSGIIDGCRKLNPPEEALASQKAALEYMHVVRNMFAREIALLCKLGFWTIRNRFRQLGIKCRRGRRSSTLAQDPVLVRLLEQALSAQARQGQPESARAKDSWRNGPAFDQGVSKKIIDLCKKLDPQANPATWQEAFRHMAVSGKGPGEIPEACGLKQGALRRRVERLKTPKGVSVFINPKEMISWVVIRRYREGVSNRGGVLKLLSEQGRSAQEAGVDLYSAKSMLEFFISCRTAQGKPFSTTTVREYTGLDKHTVAKHLKQFKLKFLHVRGKESEEKERSYAEIAQADPLIRQLLERFKDWKKVSGEDKLVCSAVIQAFIKEKLAAGYERGPFRWFIVHFMVALRKGKNPISLVQLDAQQYTTYELLTRIAEAILPVVPAPIPEPLKAAAPKKAKRERAAEAAAIARQEKALLDSIVALNNRLDDIEESVLEEERSGDIGDAESALGDIREDASLIARLSPEITSKINELGGRIKELKGGPITEERAEEGSEEDGRGDSYNPDAEFLHRRRSSNDADPLRPQRHRRFPSLSELGMPGINSHYLRVSSFRPHPCLFNDGDGGWRGPVAFWRNKERDRKRWKGKQRKDQAEEESAEKEEPEAPDPLGEAISFLGRFINLLENIRHPRGTIKDAAIKKIEQHLEEAFKRIEYFSGSPAIRQVQESIETIFANFRSDLDTYFSNPDDESNKAWHDELLDTARGWLEALVAFRDGMLSEAPAPEPEKEAPKAVEPPKETPKPEPSKEAPKPAPPAEKPKPEAQVAPPKVEPEPAKPAVPEKAPEPEGPPQSGEVKEEAAKKERIKLPPQTPRKTRQIRKRKPKAFKPAAPYILEGPDEEITIYICGIQGRGRKHVWKYRQFNLKRSLLSEILTDFLNDRANSALSEETLRRKCRAFELIMANPSIALAESIAKQLNISLKGIEEGLSEVGFYVVSRLLRDKPQDKREAVLLNIFGRENYLKMQLKFVGSTWQEYSETGFIPFIYAPRQCLNLILKVKISADGALADILKADDFDFRCLDPDRKSDLKLFSAGELNKLLALCAPVLEKEELIDIYAARIGPLLLLYYEAMLKDKKLRFPRGTETGEQGRINRILLFKYFFEIKLGVVIKKGEAVDKRLSFKNQLAFVRSRGAKNWDGLKNKFRLRAVFKPGNVDLPMRQCIIEAYPWVFDYKTKEGQHLHYYLDFIPKDSRKEEVIADFKHILEKHFGFRMDEESGEIDPRLRKQIGSLKEMIEGGGGRRAMVRLGGMLEAMQACYPWAFNLETAEGRHLHPWDFTYRGKNEKENAIKAFRHAMEKHLGLIDAQAKTFSELLHPGNFPALYRKEGLTKGQSWGNLLEKYGFCKDAFLALGGSIYNLLSEAYPWIFDLKSAEGRHLHPWEFIGKRVRTVKWTDEMIGQALNHVALKHRGLELEEGQLISGLTSKVLKEEGLERLLKMFSSAEALVYHGFPQFSDPLKQRLSGYLKRGDRLRRGRLSLANVFLSADFKSDYLEVSDKEHCRLFFRRELDNLLDITSAEEKERLRRLYKERIGPFLCRYYEGILEGKLKAFPKGTGMGEQGRLNRIILLKYFFEVKLGLKMEEGIQVDPRLYYKNQAVFLSSFTPQLTCWDELFTKFKLWSCLQWGGKWISVPDAFELVYPWAFDYNTAEGLHLHFLDFQRRKESEDKLDKVNKNLRHIFEKHLGFKMKKATKVIDQRLFAGVAREEYLRQRQAENWYALLKAEIGRDITLGYFKNSFYALIKACYPWAFDLEAPEGQHLHPWDFSYQGIWQDEAMIEAAVRHLFERHLGLINAQNKKFDALLRPAKFDKLFKREQVNAWGSLFARYRLEGLSASVFNNSLYRILVKYYPWIFDLDAPEYRHIHSWDFIYSGTHIVVWTPERIKEAVKHIAVKHRRLELNVESLSEGMTRQVLKGEGAFRLWEMFGCSMSDLLHFVFPDLFERADWKAWFPQLKKCRHIVWSKVPLSVQRRCVEMLAAQLGKKPLDLTPKEFEITVPALRQSLIGLLQRYRGEKGNLRQALIILKDKLGFLDFDAFSVLRQGNIKLIEAAKKKLKESKGGRRLAMRLLHMLDPGLCEERYVIKDMAIIEILLEIAEHPDDIAILRNTLSRHYLGHFNADLIRLARRAIEILQAKK